MEYMCRAVTFFEIKINEKEIKLLMVEIFGGL